MFENYLKYLNFISAKLEDFFAKQKPYIFCKEGCALCCKNAQFPYSHVEILYLLYGVQQLSDDKIDIIMQNIEKTKKNFVDYTGEKSTFKYDCPFLINDACSVYEYRGIICRAFGLMNISEKGRCRVPFCCFSGYNYSNVMDDTGNKISQEKFEKLGVEEEPLSFNTSYNFLTDEDFAKSFGFNFGEKKPLIEWFFDKNMKK